MPAAAGNERAFIPALKGQFKRPRRPSQQAAAGQRGGPGIADDQVIEGAMILDMEIQGNRMSTETTWRGVRIDDC